MPRTLDVDLLRTFHAVAKLGRFKDAAAHVNRSPSSVTAQIQKLEEMVAQRLFTRNNQAVELTQYGHKLLSDTTEFLLSLRIPRSSGHPFHEHLTTDSTLIRPPIPRASGH
ncbi:LysR family transcriptional regulator [Burkholderia contaminans]|uniref:LysR family transcriptional regulator n=1 Tax=Burkholderia contaminans TaxID=488447 RepID=A0AAP4QX47_9BURK|nr:LysR family transcriptional regulator [Burkholderia contaminans]MDN7563448.1 LysR family transcriptional regulator [Burkholderia contaminans]